MRTVLVTSCLAALGLIVGVVGCSEGGDVDTADSAITPENAETPFDQAELCASLVRDKIGVRDADLKGGVVRWKCGDVDGVQFDPDVDGNRSDFGQEYCEYHAVVAGKRVDLTARPPAGEVKCVYTSAHQDSSVNVSQLQGILKSQIASEVTPEPAFVKMVDGVNSRGAADALINDCAELGTSANLKNAERQVACMNAANSASQENKQLLRQACRGKDLGKKANWDKAVALGAKELAAGDNVEVNRDIVTCTQSLELAPTGKLVPWRNSDPTICARVMRASAECGDTFGRIPAALPGFSMTSWISETEAPVGCEYGKDADGNILRHLLVCTPAAAEVTKAKQAGKIMQQMCNEQFGNLVAMAAPVGALARKGTKGGDSPFCKEFHAGIDAMKK